MAYEAVVFSPLRGRTAKPRSTGQTMVIDKGMGLSQVVDLLELAAEYIDFVKLGFGTAALYPTHLLKAKTALIRSYGVHVYPGGTFLEVAVTQQVLPEYLLCTKSLGFDYIEVSDGTIDLPQAERREAIRMARGLGLGVITEVGKKESGSALEPIAALEQIRADLENGAAKVILEGRESGKGVGLYDEAGDLRCDEIEQVTAGLPEPDLLMWEAPNKAQQVAFIRRFGPNVNLGNIAPGEAVALECLRRGLRSDTFQHLALEAASGTGAL